MAEVKENNLESQADEIAKELITMLAEGFRKKEGREPTMEELEELSGELTEERLNAFFNGEEETASVTELGAKDTEEEEEKEKAEAPKKEDKVDVKDDKENVVLEPNGKDTEMKESKIVGEKRSASEGPENDPKAMAFKWPKVDAV
jgi:hypothetical protein